ncbi:MAG: hypothetical protein H8E34_10890 [Bacteroidetes bacterium]|nr:hypothetical protein [Bacteroidota bacterium]
MGQITLLRTMTGKSIIGFGRYADMSVQQVIDLRKAPYLRWLYFNFTKITFTDDILDEINLWEEFRIDKPGKCPEKHKRLSGLLYDRLHYKSKKHIDKRIKSSKIKKMVNFRKHDHKAFSKDKLTRNNHGHK